MDVLLTTAFRAILAGHDIGACWSAKTEELNINLVAWNAHEGVARHVNHAVDAVIVVLSGVGTLTVDDVVTELDAGTVVTIPRGATRSIMAETRLIYVSVHRTRPGLMPVGQGDR